MCWVGGEITKPFSLVTFGLLRAWHACAGTMLACSAKVVLIDSTKIILFS